MSKLISCLAAGLLSAAVVGFAPSASAKNEEWQDIHGNTFSGTAVEALGPFAVFSVSNTVGRRLPMQALPLSQLVRFYQAVKDHPPRADNWEQAKSALTSELRGHLQKLEGKKLVSYSVAGHPEPELIVVFFVNQQAGDSWKILGPSWAPYSEIQKVYPGMMEALTFGMGYSRWEYEKMAADQNAPWLAADLEDEGALDMLQDYIPGNGYSIVAMTRDGVPLFSAVNPSQNETKKFWGVVGEFLSLLSPENPYSWKPVAWYRTAEQIAEHPTGRVGPELVGNPIRGDVLKRYKIYSFDAELGVKADGTVSDVDLKKTASIPPKIGEAIQAALKMAVFVPAVDNGKPADGTFAYHFRIQP